MYKKPIVLALAILMVIGLVFSAGLGCKTTPSPDTGPTPTPEEEAKPIRVGWVVSLTGPLSSSGVDTHELMIPYIEKVNNEGGIAGHPLEFIIADAESDATKAVLAAKKLILEDDIHLLWGDFITGMTIPVGMTAAENEITHMAYSGSPAFDMMLKDAGEEIYKWNFSALNAPFVETFTPANKLAASFGTKIAVVDPDTSYGKSMTGGMKALAPKFGLEIVTELYYPGDATTFGPQIAAIKANPDIEFIASLGAEAAGGLWVAALRQAGITLPIVITNQCATPPILGIQAVREGYAVEPAVYVMSTAPDCWETLPDEDPRKDNVMAWNKVHEELLGKKITGIADSYGHSIMAYQYEIWGKLLEAQPDLLDQDLKVIRSTTRDQIETIENFYGSAGTVTFSSENHNGMTPGSGWLISRFQYPPPFEYIPGFEAAPPPRK